MIGGDLQIDSSSIKPRGCGVLALEDHCNFAT